MVTRKILILFSLTLATLIVIQGAYRSRNIQPISEDIQTIIPPVEASAVNSVDSPDGKSSLIMKTIENSNTVNYSFLVSGKEIFSKSVDPSISFSIPANTWSPNNKYVFLREDTTEGTGFFVLSAAKDSSLQNEQTANIENLFSKKYPNLKIGDVTGWGGVNLIIINSENADGGRGPSFWFEVPGYSLIRLSTRF